jgi:hypothetical protein
MNITECSRKLRQLSENYSHHKLSFKLYRVQRNELLDKLDLQYNGIIAKQVETLPDTPSDTQLDATVPNEQQDKTQPYLASKIGRCMNFLKRNTEQ